MLRNPLACRACCRTRTGAEPRRAGPDKIGVMRYIVLGAGAIGGTIGGRLAQAGHDVVLVARGAHLDALRARVHRVGMEASGNYERDVRDVMSGSCGL